MNKVRFKNLLREKNPMRLNSLLIAALNASIVNLFSKKVCVEFPEKIGDYKFIELKKKKAKFKHFKLGIYKNKEGKKVFAKMWTGSAKDYRYYSFKNEIRSLIILGKVAERVKKELPKDLKSVSLPKLYNCFEDKNTILAFIEYKNGGDLFDRSTKTKIDAYFKVAEYLKFLGQKMTRFEKSKFSHRGIIEYVLLFPFLVVKSIISFPGSTFQILKGVPKFITGIFFLSKTFESELVHRDLHFKNIMKNGKNLVLVDLQYVLFTEILLEIATTLRHRTGMDDFEKTFINEINKKYYNRMFFEETMNGMVVNAIIHGLTDSTYSKEIVNRWTTLLDKVNNNLVFKKNIRGAI